MAINRCAISTEQGMAITAALLDVEKERYRQIFKEGFDAEHDDKEEREGQMAGAAACYAFGQILYVGEESAPGIISKAATVWPWSKDWWKPTTRRRNLIKGAALLIAEIERLDRASQKDRT